MYSIQYLWSKIVKKCRGVSAYNYEVHSTSKLESGTHFINSSMGKYSFCGYDCEIENCEIGSFCSIANNVKIGGARHPIEWVSTSPVFYSGRDSVKKKFTLFNRDDDKKTYIGNDVWIGANVIIIQGVKIGNGAVIGAGSVVTKDVLDYEIVAGNPARVIRKRFSDDVIHGLLDVEWWNLPETKLSGYAQHIKEPMEFINHIKDNNMHIRISEYNNQRGGGIYSISYCLAA